MKFVASIDNGQGGRDIIEADSIAEALDAALDWAREGDWSIALERPRPVEALSEDYVQVRVSNEVTGEDAEGAFLPWDIPEEQMSHTTRRAARRLEGEHDRA